MGGQLDGKNVEFVDRPNKHATYNVTGTKAQDKLLMMSAEEVRTGYRLFKRRSRVGLYTGHR